VTVNIALQHLQDSAFFNWFIQLSRK